MDFTLQSSRARAMHSTLLASGEKTCIDCHKGIAHQLPDMTGVPWGFTEPSEVLEPWQVHITQISADQSRTH
jgi:cytochrome c-type protein NapC